MTASKQKPLTLGSIQNYYKAFHRAADRGHFRKAFAILKAQPDLVVCMTLLEMPCHCAMMSHKLSKEEMSHLIRTLQKRLTAMQEMLRMAKLVDNDARKRRRTDKPLKSL